MKSLSTLIFILCCSVLYAKNAKETLKKNSKQASLKTVTNYDYFEQRRTFFLEQKSMKWKHKNPTYYA